MPIIFGRVCRGSGWGMAFWELGLGWAWDGKRYLGYGAARKEWGHSCCFIVYLESTPAWLSVCGGSCLVVVDCGVVRVRDT